MSYSSRIKLLLKGPLLFALLLGHLAVQGSQVILAWDPSPTPEVTGYMIHYGTANGTYSQTLNVSNVTTAAVSNLTEGVTYFFAVTAYVSPSMESDFSNEVSTQAKLRLGATKVNNQARISFDSIAGRRYYVERTDSLPVGVWTVVATNLMGTGAPLQITEPIVTNIAVRVYRANSAP